MVEVRQEAAIHHEDDAMTWPPLGIDFEYLCLKKGLS
jgi:hypothetical protein